MFIEVFNLISKLRNIEKQKLIITPDEEFIIRAFYPKIKKWVSPYLWRKVVIDFSINTMSDIYDSCDTLQDVIYKKYNKT